MLYKPTMWTNQRKLVFFCCLALLPVAIAGFYLALDRTFTSFLLTLSIAGLLFSLASADAVSIRFSDGMVTVARSGMVMNNIELSSIVRVAKEQRGHISGVSVECTGDVIHFVPLSMFNDVEQDEIVQRLSNV
ncbi:hypothetical protein [Corallincola spongiicola]|uniref:PH domain-containing protein n=1 Tax=Corallincola spongiicola TaxID=2520508 RepID=A0ABY1WVE2_9GAMM|nr:hypothetical protein [Corallincola spongiicola]TAA48546.1 hypothetical protein EXY25_04815 [Corallincola spongiicola]